jgi:hypothetical protein
MATATTAKADNPFPIHTDTIVRRLDLFPELVRALRDGDLLAGRVFCAELFDCKLAPTFPSRDKSSVKRILPFA